MTLTLFGVFDIHMQAIGEYCILLLCVNVLLQANDRSEFDFVVLVLKSCWSLNHFFTHF